MANKLIDLTGLGAFLAKLKNWTTAQINSAKTALQTNIDKKADKTTTVNGHALTDDVTVTKSDVGLANVTNDAQVKRSEMGAPSGVATLGTDGKVPTAQLPTLKTVNGQSIVGSGNISIDLSLYKVVTSLPSSGIDTTKIYLVLSSSKGAQNTYTEYIYVNSAWEKLGEYKADVDLTPYVKFTDLATASKAGAMSADDKAKLDGLNTQNTIGVINITDLDLGIKSVSDALKYVTVGKNMRYIVCDDSKNIVGVLDVFSDNSSHLITEVFTTHYDLNESDFSSHTDSRIYTYFRSYGITSPHIGTNTWTPWMQPYGYGHEFIGVANPTTVPGEELGMYIATQSGTYTNFIGMSPSTFEDEAVSVAAGEVALLYNDLGNGWQKVTLSQTATTAEVEALFS